MASHSQATSSSSWDQPCSDAHLAQISQWIPDWRELAPFLGLTDVEEQNIIGYPPTSVPVQRMRMLMTWRQKQRTMATYNRLADALRLCNKEILVDRLSELLAKTEQITRGESDCSVLMGAQSKICRSQDIMRDDNNYKVVYMCQFHTTSR